jgi:hypothetical protein
MLNFVASVRKDEQFPKAKHVAQYHARRGPSIFRALKCQCHMSISVGNCTPCGNHARAFPISLLEDGESSVGSGKQLEIATATSP